jgi:putative transposase
MASHRLPVQLACRVLGVAESGYYEWRNRAPSARALRHVWLTDAIRAVHTDSFGTYGARRVHAELTMGLGIAVGHNAVEMLMRRADIRGLPGRKRRKSVHDTPTAVDLVDRNFSRDAPNQLWVTDITEHPTAWIPAVVATVGTTRRPVKRLYAANLGRQVRIRVGE